MTTMPYPPEPSADQTQWGRRRFVGTLASLAAAGAGLASAGPAVAQGRPSSGSARVAIDRAKASYAAMQTHLAVDDGLGLYHEHYPAPAEGNAYSYEWPFSQAHIAALDLSSMRGSAGTEFLPALAQHSDAQMLYWTTRSTTGFPGFASYVEAPHGQGGDIFYDDNMWVALADLQRYLVHGDEAALERAKVVFELIASGWDDDPTHAAPGGIWWTQAPWSQDRNTVSNMPAAQVALRLHQISGEQFYLDEALRYYTWTNTWLQRPDGLYNDHLNNAGDVEKTIWTYNQGVPVGVNVLLHEITGEARYLAEAERIAAAAHEFYAVGGRLDRQPAFFNSIYFKNLLLLERANQDTSHRAEMVAFSDRVWEQRRDPATGLFRFREDGRTELLEQAAMTQIYAVLGWPHGKWEDLY